MNNITVAGPLGRDAELRTLSNGDQVANFSVADSQGKEKPTIWWNCQLFGKRAQSLAPYLMKGQQVAVSGNLTEREWKDKEGNPRKSLELRVNDVALQGGKPKEAAQEPRAQSSGGHQEDPDGDIPFAPMGAGRSFMAV